MSVLWVGRPTNPVVVVVALVLLVVVAILLVVDVLVLPRPTIVVLMQIIVDVPQPISNNFPMMVACFQEVPWWIW